MIIRKAKKTDSAHITPLLLSAMQEIVNEFIGTSSEKLSYQFLEELVKEENNQYSYENCWVVEIDNEIVAAINIYNGDRLHELREPVEKRIWKLFNRPFIYEDETNADEYYIDCLAVSHNAQGKGIGTKLLAFILDEFHSKNRKPIGLLVDRNNPKAKKLYLKLGFKFVKNMILAGKEMEHLQYS